MLSFQRVMLRLVSARRGDLVQFINIKAKATGNPIKIKTVTPVVIELAN